MTTEERLSLDVERVADMQYEASVAAEPSVWEGSVLPDVLEFAIHIKTDRGMSRLGAMIFDGRIFDRGRELGIRKSISALPEEEPPLTAEETELLAFDIADRMIPKLRRQLEQAEWNGSLQGAAPLGSWFINLCCLNFSDVWLRHKNQRPTLSIVGAVEIDDAVLPLTTNHEGAVIYDLTFQHHLEVLDEHDRPIMWLESLGAFSDEQIGILVGISGRSVEYRKRKSRKVMQALWDEEIRLEESQGDVSSTAI